MSESIGLGSTIDAALDLLTMKGILYEERGKYFTLAIPEHPYY